MRMRAIELSTQTNALVTRYYHFGLVLSPSLLAGDMKNYVLIRGNW